MRPRPLMASTHLFFYRWRSRPPWDCSHSGRAIPTTSPIRTPFAPEPGASDTTAEDDFGRGDGDRNDGPDDTSRVSVVNEHPPRPAPPRGASEDEYQFHTYKVYPSGRPDAVEFVDVYKAFGRAHILRGLSMGLPEGMVSMILGPSGTGKSVCIKHIVGLLYPDEGEVLVHGESVPNMSDERLFELRKRFAFCSRTERCSAQ